MVVTTQRPSVAVQYSAAQAVAEALGLSVSRWRPTATHERRPRWAAAQRQGMTRGNRAAWVSSQGPRWAMRLFCTAWRFSCCVV